MSAVCPACGVAVVPGYVRCPKCQAPLPARRRLGTQPAGGTTVANRGIPLLVLGAGGVLVLAIVLVLALRGGGEAPASVAAPDEATDLAGEPDVPGTRSPGPVNPELAVPVGPITTGNNTVDPRAIARDLERALRRQRLWAGVEVIGDRIEIRSGSCRDDDMSPMVEAASTALKNAGLTRLRCVEQSGAVVFERDL